MCKHGKWDLSDLISLHARVTEVQVHGHCGQIAGALLSCIVVHSEDMHAHYMQHLVGPSQQTCQTHQGVAEQDMACKLSMIFHVFMTL